MTALWVVAAHRPDVSPFLPDCLASIRWNHPGDDRTLVVDPDHYATSAWRYGLETDADFFYLIHDSCVVNANMSHVEQLDVGVLRWFGPETVREGGDVEWTDKQLARLGVARPEFWAGVFGPVMWCRRHVLEELADMGVLDLAPETKAQASSMERIVGMALWTLGYDVREFALQGHMSGFYDRYDGTYMVKRHGGRK